MFPEEAVIGVQLSLPGGDLYVLLSASSSGSGKYMSPKCQLRAGGAQLAGCLPGCQLERRVAAMNRETPREKVSLTARPSQHSLRGG